jgi:hypothetical protein
MTLPDPPPLLVTVEDVCDLAGLNSADPDAADKVEKAIRRVTADVVAYLGQPVQPTQYTEHHRPPAWDRESLTWGYDLTYAPLVEVVSAVAEVDQDQDETGLFTVTYIAGIDAAETPYAAIRQYILRASAYADPVVVRLTLAASLPRDVKSVSADGQSVTFADRPQVSKSTSAEGVPAMETMDEWRVRGRTAYTRPGWTPQPQY